MSLLGIAGGLLGGIMGRNSEKKAIERQNEYNKPINVRARAEEAGFNPLLFVGPGVGQQTTTGGTNYMGNAIADAGLMLADDMAKRRDAVKLDQVLAKNRALAEKVQALTLRPKVGGIYAANVATPSMSAAVGVSDVQTSGRDGRLDDPVALLDGASGGIAVPDARLDRGAGFYVAGQRIEAAPGWSPAAVAENEYGDIGQAFYGLAKAAADWTYTRSRKPGQTRGKPLSMRDGIEMPPGYTPKYPKSKSEKVREWKLNFGWPTGSPVSGGW